MVDRRYKNRPLCNELTPQEQLLLVRMMEECGEIIQIASKTLRFGLHNYHPADPSQETNLAALGRELRDLDKVRTEFEEAILSPS